MLLFSSRGALDFPVPTPSGSSCGQTQSVSGPNPASAGPPECANRLSGPNPAFAGPPEGANRLSGPNPPFAGPPEGANCLSGPNPAFAGPSEGPNRLPARIRHSQARQKVQTAFPARIRPSRARHFATNCRPGTSIHPQTLLTDRFEVHFTALARVFGHSEWYRCRRRDETAGFRGFCVVSVPEVGRDCRFPGIPSGLGA